MKEYKKKICPPPGPPSETVAFHILTNYQGTPAKRSAKNRYLAKCQQLLPLPIQPLRGGEQARITQSMQFSLLSPGSPRGLGRLAKRGIQAKL